MSINTPWHYFPQDFLIYSGLYDVSAILCWVTLKKKILKKIGWSVFANISSKTDKSWDSNFKFHLRTPIRSWNESDEFPTPEVFFLDLDREEEVALECEQYNQKGQIVMYSVSLHSNLKNAFRKMWKQENLKSALLKSGSQF